MSNLKYNINKLHGILLNDFNDVKIEESSNLKFGNHFILSVNESMEVKVILTKNSIEGSQFDWLYYSDPTDSNSHLVERKSTIDSFSDDIRDILNKKRFDSDYLSKFN
jgi:hypothetical protein